jgi:hypothetical protein
MVLWPILKAVTTQQPHSSQVESSTRFALPAGVKRYTSFSPEDRSMRKVIKVSCAFGLIALCAGCSTTRVGVAAQHAAVTAHQAEPGNINTPGYEIGDLVAVNPQTKAAWRVCSVQPKASELKFGQPADSKTEPFNSGFDLAFDKKVPVQTAAEVGEAVRANTELHTEKTWSRSLKSPELFAVEHEEFARKMAKVREQDPQAEFFVVSTVTAAEKVYLTLGESGKNVMVLGKYQFNFKYDQNSELEKLAKQSAAFFTLTPIALARTEDGRNVATADSRSPENIPQFTFVETGTAW